MEQHSQEPAGRAPLHIFLIRHSKPLVSRQGLYDHTRASQFLREYDAAAIEAVVTNPPGLPYAEIKRVHCSALPRARQTAQAIFGPAVELIEDRLFNECERRILALPLLRFPLQVWLAGARLLWLMGLNSRGIENYRQARKRARQGAEALATFARDEKKTVLVAHGLLNLLLRNYLKKMGWQVIHQEGHGYLAVTELVKPVATEAQS
jgi:broad specificity phosphatase PhoE